MEREENMNIEDLEVWLRDEHRFVPSPQYVEWARSNEKFQTTRFMAVELIFRIGAAERMDSRILWRAVNFLDRFCGLNKPSYENVMKIALTSLVLAVKFCDSERLIVGTVVEYDALLDKSDIAKAEAQILAALRWHLHAITPYNYVYSVAHAADPAVALQLSQEASFLIDLSSYDLQCSCHLPSIVAAGALVGVNRRGNYSNRLSGITLGYLLEVDAVLIEWMADRLLYISDRLSDESEMDDSGVATDKQVKAPADTSPVSVKAAATAFARTEDTALRTLVCDEKL